MRHVAFRTFILVQLSLFAYVGEAPAWSGLAEEAVTCRTNTTLVRGRGDEWLPLEKELALAANITVFTNAQFQVKDGRKRSLAEGQILRADGFLLNTDGTTEPVCDHLIMQGGGVVVVRDGEAQSLTGSFTLPDGSVIERDGSYVRAGAGRRSRLVDGQMVKLNGESLPGLDTISLRNGKVVVYKKAEPCSRWTWPTKPSACLTAPASMLRVW